MNLELVIKNFKYFSSLTIIPNEYIEFIKIFPQNYNLNDRISFILGEVSGSLIIFLLGYLLQHVIRKIKNIKPNQSSYWCLLCLTPLCFNSTLHIYLILFLGICHQKKHVFIYPVIFLPRIGYNLFIL